MTQITTFLQVRKRVAAAGLALLLSPLPLSPSCDPYPQDFVDQNFSSKDLKRVIREPTMYDKMLRTPPDLKVGRGMPSSRDYIH